MITVEAIVRDFVVHHSLVDIRHNNRCFDRTMVDSLRTQGVA